jgi:hypothetical protein
LWSSAVPSHPSPFPSLSSLLYCIESRRSGEEEVISAGHVLLPLLPSLPRVILLCHRIPDVTTETTELAHASTTTPATRDCRRPRHGHAEATSWTPPCLPSPAYKRHPELAMELTTLTETSQTTSSPPSLPLSSSPVTPPPPWTTTATSGSGEPGRFPSHLWP